MKVTSVIFVLLASALIIHCQKLQEKPAETVCEAGASKTVDCNECSCSRGDWACTRKACDCDGEMVRCVTDPCLDWKKECPQATSCDANFCGGCNAQYFDKKGNEVCVKPDCSKVLCPRPNCEENMKAETPEGECCPVCVPKCGPVCAIFCEFGNKLDEEGCPTCNCNEECNPAEKRDICDDCTCSDGKILCPPGGAPCALECKNGFKVDKNGCDLCECKDDKPDCKGVSCLRPVCTDSEKLETPEGKCCPVCVPECGPVCQIFCEFGNKLDDNGCPTCNCNEECNPAGTLCHGCVCEDGKIICPPGGAPCELECENGFKVDKNGCDTCECKDEGPDCSAVLCKKPDCDEETEKLETPEGECCPQCVPKCGPVCAIFCEFGNKLNDEGCPICECEEGPDCSAVLCIQVVCDEDTEKPEVPEGECCPVCVPKCGPVCAIFCEFGNKLDDEGCPICECKEEEEPECTFFDGCNTCNCGDEGQISCTRKFCPCEGEEAECLVDPCDIAREQCPETVYCRADYCGGCTAYAFNKEGERVCGPDSEPKVCTEGATRMNDCNECTCLNNDWACTDMACECDGELTNCFVDPCFNAESACPQATSCDSNYCNGCNARYYDEEGNEVCDRPDCSAVLCVKLECDETEKPHIPKGECCAVCVPKCGPVCAIFCEFGNKLDDEGCPTCECNPDPCPEVTCPTAKCSLGFKNDENGCQTCECKEDCTFYDGCNWCTCNDDGLSFCTKRACFCEDDLVQCVVDPCEVARQQCPETAYCRSDYCGGCTAYAFDANGNRVCEPKPSVCVDGATKTVDCNECTCQDGDWACTEKACGCDGTVVNCFADPCLNWEAACPEATSCNSNFCDGCNAQYFDANGKEVCQKCQPLPCDVHCPFGHEKDENGCDTCTCVQTCAPVLCEVLCPFGFAFDEDGCQTCECEEGEMECEIDQDHCDTCVCEDGKWMCSEEPCEIYCRFGFKTDDKGCEICECKDKPVPDCRLVRCARPVCNPTTHKLVVEEGDCCPTCVPIDIACDGILCEGCNTGDEEVVVPGQCCPKCVPRNFCDTIDCPILDCDEDRQRKGKCCAVCEQCEDDNGRHTTCNDNDVPVCIPGERRGKYCDEDVPEDFQIKITIFIVLPCDYSLRRLERWVGEKIGLNRENIDTEFVKELGEFRGQEMCLARFSIRADLEDVGGNFEEEAHGNALKAIEESPELRLAEENEVDDGSDSDAASNLLIPVSLLLVLLAKKFF